MMNKYLPSILFLVSFVIGGYYFLETQRQHGIVHVVSAETQIHQPVFLEVDQLHDIVIELETYHILPPEHVRAVYMSSWVGGTKTFRNNLISFIKKSDINALVLDIKDYSGLIAFQVDDELIDSYGTDSKRISDIEDLITELHDNDIYIIGRITLFQDPLLAQKAPHLAFKRKDNGEVWMDRKNLAFIDPKQTEAHEYFARIAEYSYGIGFDEINFDYIRYPSDGNISNLNYNLLPGEKKKQIMKTFYAFLDERLRTQGIPISADLFGMTTVNIDDLSIGQYLEDALTHFDYVAPMVYPSHYPNGFRGYRNPAEHPYEIVYDAMKSGVTRAKNMGLSGDQLRTWIQDFDLGATYDAHKITEQIRASYDAGVDSYMVWDPSNKYTQQAYMTDLVHPKNYENTEY